MKAIILYATKTGNTEKTAKSISEALKIDSLNISTAHDPGELEKYDIFFLGSGVYGGGPHKDIIKFLANRNFRSKKTFAPFFTWLGRGQSDRKAFETIKKLITGKNQIVYDNYYRCYGKSFLCIRAKHPDEKDLQNAINWAGNILQSL